MNERQNTNKKENSFLKRPTEINSDIILDNEEQPHERKADRNTRTPPGSVLSGSRVHGRAAVQSRVAQESAKRAKILSAQRERIAIQRKSEGVRPRPLKGPAAMLADKKLEARLKKMEEERLALETKSSETEQQLEASVAMLQANKERIEELEKEAELIRQENKIKEEQLRDETLNTERQKRELGDLKQKCMSLETELEQKEKIEIAQYKKQIQQSRDKETQFREEIELLKINTEKREKEKRALQNEYEKQKQLYQEAAMKMEELQKTLSVVSSTLESTGILAENKSTQIQTLSGTISDQQKRIAELEENLVIAERIRRKLHNQVLELKGNIRVFCRVRPPMQDEAGEQQHMVLSETQEEQSIELAIPTETAEIGTARKTKNIKFTFDRVFAPQSSQQKVFQEIEQLVQSVLDGYRVCVFAYGQTGSGKTHTMEGPAGVYSNASLVAEQGMIPRAVSQIFAAIEQLKERGWSYAVETSFLEIYNESIRDLLSARSTEEKHEIKHSGTATYVTNLTTQHVTEAEEAIELLSSAASRRSFAWTLCNERSSRSHTVFTLKISGENSQTEEKAEGILHLIDLAGSERLSQSGSTGERLKETQAINKSLSSLGDVISALYMKEKHIPYRNSKLTYLLQNSLGGDSKTLMFANISPSLSDLNETVCSLRFATKVNSCEIGTARRKHTVQ